MANQQAQQSGRQAGQNYARGFDRAANESSTFGRVAATTAAKATLVGAAAAAAAPGLLQLTAALVPATGAAIALPAALLSIKAVTGTVKLAALGVGEAIQEGFTGSAEKAAEALKALPPEARIFAKSVIGLKGDLEGLRTVVSDRMFAPINESFEPLVNRYLPLAQTQLPRISQAVGATAGQFAIAATKGQLFGGVNAVLENTSLAIALANENVFGLTDALGNVLKVGAPVVAELGRGFGETSGKVAEFINEAAKTGQLAQWMRDGINTIKTLGSIAGNVFGIVNSLMRAATASGGNLLITLRDITGQIDDFLKSGQGLEGLNATFKVMGDIGQGLRTGLGAALPAIAQSAAIAGPTIGQLAQVAGDLVVAVAPLLPYFTELATLLLRLLIPALASLAKFMAEHETLMKVVATAIGVVVLATKAYAAAVFLATAYTKAATIATTAWTVITRIAAIASNAWAVAQWALNVAMTANPIGVVIAIVIALVAAIVLAYKNSETFRKIVQAAWQGIQTAAKWAWDNVLKPVMNFIIVAAKEVGGWFTWLWKNAIQPAWAGIKIVIQVWWAYASAVFDAVMKVVRVMADIFMWFWRNIITPVWKGIELAIKIAWKAIEIVFGIIEVAVRALAMLFTWYWKNVIVPVWQGISSAISTAWNWINNNVFQPIIRFVSGVFTTLWRTYQALVTAVWTAIRNALMAAWNWIRDNVFNPLRNFITGALVNSWNTAKNLIVSAWNAIKTPIAAAWHWIRDNVFSPIQNFITKTIPNAFSTGVSAIKSAWDKVKEAAAVPIRFVVNTVINNGIIKGFNWISDKVGGPHIDPINLGFARGGILPGYTPGRDVHRFHGRAGTLDLSGGEAIMRPEFTKAVGSNFIEMMNAAARRGGVAGVRRMMMTENHERFKDGGIWGGIKAVGGNIVDGVKGAWNALTNPVDTFKGFIKGMLGNIPGLGFVKDMAIGAIGKVVDSVANWITSKFNAFGGSFGDWPSGPGAQRGDSGVWRNIVKLINSTGPLSGSFGNGYRPGDPLWHGSGRAVDWMGFNQDALASFLAARRPLELIHRTNSRDYAYSRGRNMGSFNAGLMEAHRNHIHIAMKRGGIFRYDRGGWFNPGQLGINQLKRPEAVLTPEESAGLKAMGTDKLIELIEELIEAVKLVAPGVGDALRGSGRGLINRARQA
jgi:hypothetical protein